MIELFLEEIFPDRDHDQADKDRAADKHVHEDDGLLKSTQGAQIERRETGDRHTGDADEEGVDIGVFELGVAGVEDACRD